MENPEAILPIDDVENSSSATDEQTPSTPINNSTSRLIERDGEIGQVNKNDEFCPLTNFAVQCVGFVLTERKSKSPEGFLFRVNPKDREMTCENSG